MMSQWESGRATAGGGLKKSIFNLQEEDKSNLLITATAGWAGWENQSPKKLLLHNFGVLLEPQCFNSQIPSSLVCSLLKTLQTDQTRHLIEWLIYFLKRECM